MSPTIEQRQHQHQAYQKIIVRSGQHCEAMVQIPHADNVWTRCGSSPIQIHHRLPRSRGGELLDYVGETYHLMALCPTHHGSAHDSTTTALMLDGSVGHGPTYIGSDAYLKEKYGEAGRG